MPTISVEQIQKLIFLVEQMKLAGTQDNIFSLTESDMFFHHQICVWSGSSTLHRAWDPLYGQIQRFVVQTHKNNFESLTDLAETHYPIIQALQNREAEEASRITVIIDGHAATNQFETLQRVAAEFNATHDTQVLVALSFVANDDGLKEVGHASRIKTLIMMALQPEMVKLDNLPSLPEPLKNPDWGIIDYLTFAGQPTADRVIHDVDDPRRATAEAGEEMLRRATGQILVRVEESLS